MVVEKCDLRLVVLTGVLFSGLVFASEKKEPERPTSIDERREAIRLEYERRKKGLGKNAGAHFELGRWCEESGLKSKADVHYRDALKLNPSHEGAHRGLGHKPAETPKGELWLPAKEYSRFLKEKACFDVPEGNTKAFLKAWRRFVPLKIKMKDVAVKAEDREKRGFTDNDSGDYFTARARRKLITQMSLKNLSMGVVECRGTTIARGRKWTDRDETVTLYSETTTDSRGRSWLGSFRRVIPFSVESKYGYKIALQYVIQVPEAKKAALRSGRASRIRKAVEIDLELGSSGRHDQSPSSGFGRDSTER